MNNIKKMNGMSSMNSQAQRNQISQGKINITHHAYIRFKERVQNENITEKDLRKLAFSARYYGLSIKHLTLSQVDNNQKLYNYLTSCFRLKSNTDEVRFYNNYVFIYTGKKSRTLRTIVNVNKKLLVA